MSFWGWVPQSIANAATKLVDAVNQQAQSMEEEQNRMRDHDPLAKIEKMKNQTARLPWEDLNVQDPQKLSALIEQIHSLSKTKRTFTQDPPADSAFEFVFDQFLPIALRAIESNDDLKRAYFTCVPRYCSEENFWRNYFYRVDLLKRAAGLEEEPARSEPIPSEDPSNHESQENGEDEKSAIPSVSPLRITPLPLPSKKVEEEVDQVAPEPRVEETILIDTGLDDFVSDHLDLDLEIVDE